MRFLVTFVMAAAVCGSFGCGGSDKTVKTQNRQVVEDDGDVKQQTTTTTTDEEGNVEKVDRKETEIHDD